MKKVYLCMLLIFSFVNAQVPTCSLDPTFISMNKYGIWPDSATNFISGTVGINYVQNITVKVPKDTTTNIGKFCFNRIVVSTPSNVTNYNLPPGLMFGSSTASLSNGTINGAPSLKFPGNANNCASIYGTPTQTGTYVLSFKVDTYATLSFTPCPNSPNINGGTNLNTTYINYYKIVIYPPASLEEWMKNPSLTELKCSPNPVYNEAKITFRAPGKHSYTIVISDIQGKNVYRYDGITEQGENQITVPVSDLQAGVYTLLINISGIQSYQKLLVGSK